MLTIDDSAKESINNCAKDLVLLVENRPERKTNKERNSEFHMDFEIKPEMIIGEMKGGEIDAANNLVSEYVYEGDLRYGLFYENYKTFHNLCEIIQHIQGIYEYVSLRTIKKELFNWVIERFRHQTQQNATEYLFEKIEPQIIIHDIYVPINGLVVDDFQLGKVIFKKITREMIDNWVTELRERREQQNETLDEEPKNYTIIRKKMQGYSAASIKVYAEPEKALSIAIDEAEKAISVLRLFSKANFMIGIVSGCTILGNENRDTWEVWFMKNKMMESYSSGIKWEVELQWKITNQMFQYMWSDGLMKLNEIISLENPSDFQKKLFQALMLYSKSTLMNSTTDKLVYVLVSIETILLKDDSERILSNISKRMANLMGENIHAREHIIEIVREMYKIRKKFIHHGSESENYDKVNIFLKYAFRFFKSLIKKHTFFQTKKDLITFLDERRLSSGEEHMTQL